MCFVALAIYGARGFFLIFIDALLPPAFFRIEQGQHKF